MTTETPYRASPNQGAGGQADDRYTFQTDAAGHIQGTQATGAGLIRATVGSFVAALAILVLFWLPSEYGLDPTGLGRIMGLTQMGEIKQQLYAEADADDALLIAETAAAQVSADPALLARLEAMEAQISKLSLKLGSLLDHGSGDVAPQASPAPDAAPIVSAPVVAAPAPGPEPMPEPAPAPEPAQDPEWRDEVSYTLAPTEGIEIKLVMAEGAVAEFEWTAHGAILNHDTHGDGSGQRITYEQGRGVPDQSGTLVAAFDGNHGWFWRNRTEEPVTFTLRTRGDYSAIKAP